MTGGRYVNLGYTGEGLSKPVIVRHGEPQIVPGVPIRVVGWPSEDMSAPVTMDMLYEHDIARIGRPDDMSKWRLLTDTQSVTFTC